MKTILIVLAILVLLLTTSILIRFVQSADLDGVTGKLERQADFPSRLVDPRHVDVWLPAAYSEDPDARYQVIYMHDGQNLFDPQTSFIGVDWGIDEAMTRLIRQGDVSPAIVVGIWNTPDRVPEYMPEKAYNRLSREAQVDLQERIPTGVKSDRYLRFIVTELKPFIDQNYRTQPDQAHTFIMGSSMGGLISLYAICEYPNVFGGGGCVSTHWPIGEGVMLDYLRESLPNPATHKIYFDHGTETLDAEYEPFQRQADAIMRQAGYKLEKNWLSLKFPGDDHSERAWRQRVHIPLLFLLDSDDGE